MVAEPEQKGRKRHDQEPVHILLVEDDPHFADLIGAQLRRTPWIDARLEVAGRLREALAKLSSGAFDLVVTDLTLPDSSGVGTVEALAGSGEHLIVVLTGDRDAALRAAAIEPAGAR